MCISEKARGTQDTLSNGNNDIYPLKEGIYTEEKLWRRHEYKFDPCILYSFGENFQSNLCMHLKMGIDVNAQSVISLSHETLLYPWDKLMITVSNT